VKTFSGVSDYVKCLSITVLKFFWILTAQQRRFANSVFLLLHSGRILLMDYGLTPMPFGNSLVECHTGESRYPDMSCNQNVSTTGGKSTQKAPISQKAPFCPQLSETNQPENAFYR
jgi:hypothetical protein